MLPPEKSETVIYILPAVSLAFWTVTLFFDTGNLTEWLALVGLLGSVFAIIAYMVPADVYVMRRLLRWQVAKKRGPAIKDFILSSNIRLQTWRTSYDDVSTYVDWQDAWSSNCVGNGVSSYPVRMRMWYWRLSLYSSIAVIIFSIPILILPLFGFTIEFPIQGNPQYSLIFPWIIPTAALAAIILPWIATYWRDYRRKKNFARDASFVAEFQYLQYLVNRDTLANPSEYIDNSPKRNLKEELDSLQEILYRNDWSVFVRRWESIRNLVREEANVNREKMFFPSILFLWFDLAEEKNEINQRRLGSLVYLGKKKKPDGIGGEIIDHLSKMTSLADVTGDDIKWFFDEHKNRDNLDMFTEWRRKARENGSQELEALLKDIDTKRKRIGIVAF